MRTSSWIVVAALCAALAQSQPIGSAVADGATAPTKASAHGARTHFDRGRRLVDRKEYSAAIVELEAAYRLDPRSEHLYNLAVAYHLAGQRTEAIDRYRAFLAQVSRGPTARLARDYLAALEAEAAAERARADAAARRMAAAAQAEAQRVAEEAARRAEVDRQAAARARNAARPADATTPPVIVLDSHRRDRRLRLAGVSASVGLITWAVGVAGHDLSTTERRTLVSLGAAAAVGGVVLWWTAPSPDRRIVGGDRVVALVPVLSDEIIGAALHASF